jgi:hypothetical protein
VPVLAWGHAASVPYGGSRTDTYESQFSATTRPVITDPFQRWWRQPASQAGSQSARTTAPPWTPFPFFSQAESPRTGNGVYECMAS